MNNEAITAQEVPTSQRATLVGKLFGVRFLWIESFVFDTAGSLSEQYDGGYWDYFALSNDGFLLVPATREHYRVACANGFEGTMSQEAFGITTCLYTYSMLSFSPDEKFGQICANHFHRLRAYALQHAEAGAVLNAID